MKNQKSKYTKTSFCKGDLVKHKFLALAGLLKLIKAEKRKLNINFGGIMRVIMASFVEKQYEQDLCSL